MQPLTTKMLLHCIPFMRWLNRFSIGISSCISQQTLDAGVAADLTAGLHAEYYQLATGKFKFAISKLKIYNYAKRSKRTQMSTP